MPNKAQGQKLGYEARPAASSVDAYTGVELYRKGDKVEPNGERQQQLVRELRLSAPDFSPFCYVPISLDLRSSAEETLLTRLRQG